MNRRLAVGVMVVLAVICAVAVLILSPLVLLLVGALFHVDWTQLSNIGQSYTGISAILSAGALIGVVISIRLQSSQNVTIQRQLVREMQFGLLRLAMEDQVCASIFRLQKYDVYTHEDYKKTVYLTQWMRYLQFGYLNGEMSQRDLQEILENEIFLNNENRMWWGRARSSWSDGKKGKDKVFVDTVEQSFKNTEQLSQEPETLGDSESSEQADT
jgi:hypothetical protein